MLWKGAALVTAQETGCVFVCVCVCTRAWWGGAERERGRWYDNTSRVCYKINIFANGVFTKFVMEF